MTDDDLISLRAAAAQAAGLGDDWATTALDLIDDLIAAHLDRDRYLDHRSGAEDIIVALILQRGEHEVTITNEEIDAAQDRVVTIEPLPDGDGDVGGFVFRPGGTRGA